MDIRSRVERLVLPNGLELLVLPMPFTPVAAVLTCVRAGSALEGEGTRGLSHLVEHMLFKGTARFPGSVFWGRIQSLGGLTNAYTSRDLTCYYEVLPAAGAEIALELEGDRMTSPSFEERDIARERDVILEERRTSCVESAAGAMEEALCDQAYRSHPYGGPVIGFERDIAAFDRSKASDFHKGFYGASNTILAVAGGVDPHVVMRAAERHFGRMPAGARAGYPAEGLLMNPPGRVSFEHPSSLPRLSVSFPAPAPGHPDWALLDMAANWLSGTRSSRLDELLVLGGMALGVSADIGFTACPGLFQIRASLYPGADVGRVESIILGEIAALGSAPLPADEFESLRNRSEVLDLIENASPFGAAGTLAVPGLTHGDAFMFSRIAGEVRRATPGDLAAACLRWLDPEKAYVTELIPEGSGSETAAMDSRGEGGDIAPPGPADLPEIPVSAAMLSAPGDSVSGGVATAFLDNGLRILMKRDDTFPLVSLALSFPMAASADPWELSGLSSVCVEALAYGGESEDYIAFNRRIERTGAGFVHEADREYSFAAAGLHARDMRTGLSFLADLVMRPAFRRDDVARVVEEKVAEIGHRTDTPFGRAVEHLAFSMAESPERSGVPTCGSVSRITRENVVSMHSACARPEGSILVAVGSFDAGRLMEDAAGLLGGWACPDVPLPPSGTPAVPREGVRLVTAMDGRTQAAVVLGTEAPARDSGDHHAFRLLARILGDGMNSRLEGRIREQHGLAYQVGCDYICTGLYGRFVAYAATSRECAGRVLEMIEDELDSAAERLFDDPLIDLFKASSVGRKAMNLHDYDSLAGYLLGSAATGRRLDRDVEDSRGTLAVTPAMIREAAARWLSRDSRFVSAAGDVRGLSF